MIAKLRALLSFCLSCILHALGLHLIPRQHKRKIHLAILFIVGADLIRIGMHVADLGFLLLSFLMEAEDAASHVPPTQLHQRASEQSLFHANTLALDRALNMLVIPDAEHYYRTLVRWARQAGVTLTENVSLGRSVSAESSPSTREIYLSAMNTSQAFYTLLHELGHVFGTMSHGTGPFTIKDYILGETEAERVAQLTVRALHLSVGPLSDLYYKNKAYAADLPPGMIVDVLHYVTPSAQRLSSQLVKVLRAS